MAVINLSINAETPEELKKVLAGLVDFPVGKIEVKGGVVTKEVKEKEVNTASGEPEVFKRASYFYHPESDAYLAFKKGEEIPTGNDFHYCESITKKEYDAGIKKQQAVKEEGSTDSISDTEPSKTGTKEPTEEKSITVGQYPDATKADVQKAMKSAMEKGKRAAIKTAFGRFNAERLSDLEEEDYSAFLTDLEALVGE